MQEHIFGETRDGSRGPEEVIPTKRAGDGGSGARAHTHTHISHYSTYISLQKTVTSNHPQVMSSIMDSCS
jgi:hypothetical protein